MSEEKKTDVKVLPKRVAPITLPAKWLVDTCALAKKYGTGLAITSKGSVCGFKSSYARSVVYYYPPNEEWVKAVLELAPDGADFPTASAIVGSTDALQSIRVYASMKIKDDSVAKIDRTTLAVSVNGVGMHVRNGVFFADDLNDIPKCATEFEDFKLPAFERCSELLEDNCDVHCSRKFLRTVNVAKFSDGSKWLISSNNSTMFMAKAQYLPENLFLNKELADIKDIVAYHHEEDDGESGYIDDTFKLSDGVCVHQRIEKPTANVPFEKIIPSDLSEYTKLNCSDVREILNDINTLGFNVIDRDSMVRISSSGITLIVHNEEVANFERDSFKEIKPNHSLTFKTVFLKRIADCGKDFLINTSDWSDPDEKVYGHLAIMKQDDALCIVMPCTPCSRKA